MMDDAPQDDWLQAARMEALEAEVRRLQSVEDALLASQAEVECLRGLLHEAVDDELAFINQEIGYCEKCDGAWSYATNTYSHTADCLVTRARALLTPPTAPEEK